MRHNGRHLTELGAAGGRQDRAARLRALRLPAHGPLGAARPAGGFPGYGWHFVGKERRCRPTGLRVPLRARLGSIQLL